MLRYSVYEKTKLLRAQNWPRYSFSRRSKLRLDEFGVKFSRQGFQPPFHPASGLAHPRTSYSSYSLVSFASYSRRERSDDGRHAHAATTFRVQKLCLWAEKIYRLRADIHIAGPVCSICLESPFETLAREIHLAYPVCRVAV